MVFVETSFPRGGTARAAPETTVETPNIEFGAATFKRKKEKLNKKQRDEKHIRENEAEKTKMEAVSAELLSLKTISEGMLVLGCINNIDATHILVSLPGRLIGRVLVTAMAPAYVDIVNKYVNDVSNVEGYKSLEDIFAIGQLVCVKVMQIKAGPDTPRAIIELSMNPADIQAGFRHQKVTQNTILTAAIESIEDHGFVLDTGIGNLRAFMPTAAAKDASFGVGQVIFCKVKSAKPSQAASTIVCSLVEVTDRKWSISSSTTPNLTQLLPSTIVKFKVTKQLQDGIQGLILNDTFTAYVNEHQLEHCLASPTDYAIDSIIDARVLYVMPLTNIVYLSLNLSETIGRLDSSIARGTFINEAKVIRIGTGGLIVRLDKEHKGLISFKSLRIDYRSNFDSDDILAKYHKNSLHRVRVTGYDPMDSLYICSTNEKVLAEKHFTLADLQIGEYVDAVIDHKLPEDSYFVRVGQVKGYIQKIQVSSSTPASKLEEGATLRCRVLCKHEKDQKVFLTNRKELMSEKASLLISPETAIVGNEYHGMISKIFADGYLVQFCQYTRGMLYKRNLTDSDANAAAYYQIGQILKFRVMFVQRHYITLGLTDFVCRTGTTLTGKVLITNENGVNVTFDNSKLNGIVPPMLLTDFPSLSPVMFQTYRSGDALEVVCVARNVYSVRDVERVRAHPVRHWDDVRTGDIIPAYVKNVKGDVVELMCLIEQYSKVIKCHVKMLLEDHSRDTHLNLVAEQLLYVRVLGKNNMLKTLTCSTRLSHVWEGQLQETASYLRAFLRDVDRIHNYFAKKSDPLAKLSAGSRIKGKVVDVNAEQATILLPNNATGIVSYTNSAEKPLAMNAVVECLVIWVDYVQNVVYLTAIPRLVSRCIPKRNKLPLKQTLGFSRNLKADVMLVLDDVAILYPEKVTERFIYVPTRFHQNDLQPLITQCLQAGSVAHVTAISVDDQYIIGMPELIRRSFERLLPNSTQSQLLKKQKRDEGALFEANRKVPKKDYRKKKEIKMEVDDEEHDDGANDENQVKLEFSGPAAFETDEKVAKEETNDEVVQGLFFEDTTGNVDLALSKRAQKRKVESNDNGQAKKCKKPLIKLEQLDGTNDDLSDCESDDEFDVNTTIKNGKTAKRKAAVDKTSKRSAKLAKKSKQSVSKQTKTEQHAPKKVSKNTAPKLPGATNFWTSDLSQVNPSKKDDSSEEDEIEASASSAKPTKLSTADRFRLGRSEEARIRSIEENLADPNATPSNVDHFERLVMTTPNSSLAWINYMVFHMQSNEIHRARLVARKAFKKISIRDPEEILNVWLALLNLELRYGDKETFDAVFVEALQVSDPFKVYSMCLQMLVSVSKVEELTDMVLTFTKKFRANPECWTNAAAALFEVGLADKAKPLLNRALASLPDRDHVSTIIKFAVLNNKYNERDTAHALMEQILSAYPKRVDCWSQYVDMLIKDKEIPIARQILDRAVSQKIPMKKMRTLFKKFLDFEQRFGDGDQIQKVKSMAAQYVETELKA